MKKMWKRLASMMAITLAVPVTSVQAQQAAPAAVATYSMPSTQMWEIPSDGGEIYRIMVSYPKGEPPADGYPVLYVLDGNAYFASFAETRRLLEYYDRGNAIVVGVGYPTDDAYDERRTADFLYPVPTAKPPAEPKSSPRPANTGRDKFLDFLTGKLRTEIGKRYKIDRDRQALFGHSFGGLFALHALYTRPDAFQSIVAASPSLEWNTQHILREEREFTAGLASGKTLRASRLMLVVGDQDVDDDPEPARALAGRLERLSGYGLSIRYRRYDDEIHITVPTRSVTDTLRFVLR
ncbi:alpha/beta hydrolase [Sphingopyxis sp. MSC1_008]|jgi:predicted alpha/beta superfamily hydrolase|uniref:alpha/beta hydrolase n=1 Tax=Sphingopyxis sp. MSC1_008 TaxID=2909265 RepID=UPI0020C065B3|nr:alpha/beta hydrolase-fold protein [Sphingopyxis sp. MSC1_008]